MCEFGRQRMGSRFRSSRRCVFVFESRWQSRHTTEWLPFPAASRQPPSQHTHPPINNCPATCRRQAAGWRTGSTTVLRGVNPRQALIQGAIWGMAGQGARHCAQARLMYNKCAAVVGGRGALLLKNLDAPDSRGGGGAWWSGQARGAGGTSPHTPCIPPPQQTPARTPHQSKSGRHACRLLHRATSCAQGAQPEAPPGSLPQNPARRHPSVHLAHPAPRLHGLHRAARAMADAVRHGPAAHGIQQRSAARGWVGGKGADEVQRALWPW